MDIKELVQEFNKVPRIRRTHYNRPIRHWQFAIHHVDDHDDDLLHMVYFDCTCPHHQESYTHVPICPDLAAQAELVMRLLLERCLERVETHDFSETPIAIAPWTWGTDSQELALALEEKLSAAGVREALCKVKVGDETKIEILKIMWLEMLQKHFQNMIGPRCFNCREPPKGQSQKLQLCAGCKLVQYCGRDCQKADWKRHKEFCQKNKNDGPSVDPLQYFWEVAPFNLEVQALAAELGVIMADPANPLKDIGDPMKQLIITGNDTRENLVKFFGQYNLTLERIHSNMRMHILLQPPRGSPFYNFTNPDNDSQFWTLREASVEELEKIQQVREMQALIRQDMGSRIMEGFSRADMQRFLTKNFGDTWVEMWNLCSLAADTMDQGFPISSS